MANEASVVLPALVRMGLAAAEEHPEIVPLTGGVSSLIVRVKTRNGPLCIKQALPELKVASHWSAPLARNHAELAWIREVAQTLPNAVPEILGEDAQSYCFAMQWLAPEQHPVWKIQLRDGQVSPDFAAQVARQLVAIHAATAHKPALAERFAYDRNFFELRLDPYFGASAQVHSDCAPMLQALIEQTASHRIALIHGDISPKNILAGPSGPIFLDAECAVYGDPAFDVAFCLTHLIAKCLCHTLPRWRAVGKRRGHRGAHHGIAGGDIAGARRWQITLGISDGIQPSAAAGFCTPLGIGTSNQAR